MTSIWLQEPPVVEIDIFDLDVALSHAGDFARTVGIRQFQVEYRISELTETSQPGREEMEFRHEATATAVSMLLASEIYFRIGQIIAASIRAQAEGMPQGDDGEEWFRADPATNIVSPLPAFILRTLDLSNPVLNQSGRCVFDISNIELGSTRVVAKLRVVVIALTMATPAMTSAAPAAISSTLATVGQLSAAGTFGFLIYTFVDEQHRKEVEEQYRHLMDNGARGEWRPMQRHLAELSFYKGADDNIVGTDTREAMSDFAECVGLPRDIDNIRPSLPKGAGQGGRRSRAWPIVEVYSPGPGGGTLFRGHPRRVLWRYVHRFKH